MPRSSSASSRTTTGSDELLDRADLVRDRAADHRDRPALPEGVDAEARDVLDFVGEVDLVLLVEFVELVLVREQVAQRLLGVAAPRAEDALASSVSSPWTRKSGEEPTLRWRSEPSLADELTQRCLDVEHAERIGSASRSRGR